MWPLLFTWLLGAGAFSGEAVRAPLLVSAALSLTEALTDCGTAFTASSGIPVRFNFGPSNALARQIVQGAPVDVFVSADLAQMEFAIREGAVLRKAVWPIAINHLVIIVPGNGRKAWSNAAPLASDAVRRVAVGDPSAVPAGVYARHWLEKTGLWGAVEQKLVPAASVRGALAAVRTGGIDAGIVYRTDARSVDGISVVFEVADAAAPLIEYPAGIVSASPRGADAGAFIDFLRGAAAQRILERRGFGRVAATITR